MNTSLVRAGWQLRRRRRLRILWILMLIGVIVLIPLNMLALAGVIDIPPQQATLNVVAQVLVFAVWLFLYLVMRSARGLDEPPAAEPMTRKRLLKSLRVLAVLGIGLWVVAAGVALIGRAVDSGPLEVVSALPFVLGALYLAVALVATARKRTLLERIDQRQRSSD